MVSGGFAFIEATNRAPAVTADFATPTFSLTGTGCLYFATHMRGQHIGSLRVVAVDGSGNELSELYNQQGETGSKYSH